MSSWLETIDPDVRQVLEDVAKDRRSKLFRLDRSRPARAPFADIEPVSARSAGWRPAERYLLETYREEVWLLIHAACTQKISLDERATSLGPVDWRRFPGQQLSSVDIRVRASGKANSIRDASLHLQTRGLIERIVHESSTRSIGYEVFALAARQLFDSHSTKLMAAVIKNIQGQSLAALELAESVASESLRADISFHAWSILGFARSQLDESANAAAAFKRAFTLAPKEVLTAANALLAAVQAGDLDLALEAGRCVDSIADVHDSTVTSLCSQYSSRRASSAESFQPNPLALKRSREALGSTSRLILDAVYL